jgi:hypothetical protein
MMYHSQIITTIFSIHKFMEQEVALLEQDTEHGNDFKKEKRKTRYVRKAI